MKDVFTVREELICGKIDKVIELLQENKIVDAIEMMDLIRYDAIRMEQKLISRKLDAEIKK